MPARRIVSALISSLAGAVATIYTETLTGWWLNSGRGVVTTAAALALLGAIVMLWGRACWERLGALWAGAMIGLTASLFLAGPGTIWPIVLSVSAGLVAASVLIGGGIGLGIRRLVMGR